MQFRAACPSKGCAPFPQEGYDTISEAGERDCPCLRQQSQTISNREAPHQYAINSENAKKCRNRGTHTTQPGQHFGIPQLSQNQDQTHANTSRHTDGARERSLHQNLRRRFEAAKALNFLFSVNHNCRCGSIIS